MVMRKSLPMVGTLPYPLSPTSPPTTNISSVPVVQHQSSSSSTPGLSATDRLVSDEAQRYLDDTPSNPWAESGEDESTVKRGLPTILRAGNGPRPAEKLPNEQNLAEAPQWGQNNVITPRSSSESQSSRDSWEKDDDNETDLTGKSAHGGRQYERLQIPIAHGEQDTGSLNPGFRSPVSAPMKRKPVGTSHESQVSETLSPSQDFGSNNPFRVSNLSNSLPQHNSPTGGDTYDWAELSNEPSSPKGKGKEVVRNPPGIATPVQRSSGLSVDDRPFGDFSSSYPPSTAPTADLESAYETFDKRPSISDIYVPPHPTAPPPPVPKPLEAQYEQPPLIPVTPTSVNDPNPWTTEKQTHFPPPTLMPGGMVDRARYHLRSPGFEQGQEIGVVTLEEPLREHGLGRETNAPPVYQEQSRDDHGPTHSQGQSEPSLLDEPEEEVAPPDHPPPQVPRTAKYKPLNEPEVVYAPPDHPPPQPPRTAHSRLLVEADYAPPQPPRPNAHNVASDAASMQKLKEQRNETYQIKHFNWFDHNTGTLRGSSMLTQNKNGPCPLLALVNALILTKPDDSESAHALRAREQVSLGLLIESLMDELTSDNRETTLEELPDVDELNRFLLKLHTGMNANPRFVTPGVPAPNLMDARNSVLHVPSTISTDRKPGSFEQTQDLKLYGAFAIPLVHGWLPQRSDPAQAAFARAAPTYEDAQTIQFGEEELEGKLSQGGLTPNEQQLWEDIVSIRSFFSTFPTQLTPYGLNVVSESLLPGAFAIMFRNDHFSTIYKHPKTGQIFTLVTDAGYAEKDEVIWESLVDVSGQRSGFFSGDFRPVGNVEETPDASPSSPVGASGHGNQRRSSQYLNVPSSAPPTSPQEIQEQHDADFAMALQLQEEEESRANGPRTNARRRSAQNAQSNTERPSNIPIRLRSTGDVGPAIPPRNQHQRNPGVNRPTNTSSVPDEDAPPLYEEAVKDTAYVPPPGHPQHASSDPSPRSSTTNVTQMGPPTTTNSSNPAPRRPSQPARTPQQRRMSAFQENAQAHAYGPRPEMNRPMSHNPGMSSGPGRGRATQLQKEQDKDCVVM